ncbi:RNA-directed DNA polymerase [Mesorhizobium abyssinicae]|uniref:RNA-directed DNA polymerase n=1 Tax=Mesorhizobium abyssinicae TaxID=1209958 RepID=A0ABU5AS04_9HYPH|nr:RNA-directed DNA polymerase [Mesorhizobium abyssinicae]MDX8540082.1 RNA-directed DNA polymerase [Mesorhizobium abyssinicae]
MKLSEQSLAWAMKHVGKEGDTDLFPTPFEFKILKKHSSEVIRTLKAVEIDTYQWKGPRRLMVPKSQFAFRSVCQLDPLDSILFAALVRGIGRKIESRRSPKRKEQVFSYRFEPKTTGKLYAATTGWEDFWTTSSLHCDNNKFVLVTDLSDYYNQIYHHTIENQLKECGVPADYWRSIKNLLGNITEGISRGIPIGPHPSHLLAEMAMIPVDNFLDSLGLTWCRYVDDIHIFCESKEAGHAALYKFVEYLDRTQKIQINKQKTDIKRCSVFKEVCKSNKLDHPINPLELMMISTVKSYTNSPYERIKYKKMSKSDADKMSRQNIEAVLRDYIGATDVDYTRLRWFIRRLTQIGAPGGVPFIVKNFDKFLPAIAEVGNYFESAAGNYSGEWSDIGDELVKVYESGIVQASEYLQVVVLSLFARIKDLNHINRLTKVYPTVSNMCQRKIVLAAAQAGAQAWLSSLKGEYKNADPWNRRAIIFGMRALPDDEKKFWLKSVKRQVVGLDKLVAESV